MSDKKFGVAKREVEGFIQESLGYHIEAFQKDYAVKIRAIEVSLIDVSSITEPRIQISKVKIIIE